MKLKLKALVLSLVLLPCLFALSACENGKTAAEPTSTPVATATPVPEPTATPEPETTPAAVRYRDVRAVYAILKAGDTLKVTAEDGDWYACELDGVTVYVEKRFIRLGSEQKAEPKTAYARSAAGTYADVYLTGEPLTELTQNTELKILETMDDCLLVELEDGTRVFLSADMVSENYIADYYSGGGDTGVGGGGSAPAGGSDGGDISLAGFRVNTEKPRIVLLTAGGKALLTPQSGTVKADGVEAYLKLLAYGDEVKVLKTEDGRAELLIDGLTATVPAEALLMQGEKKYEAWEGYIQSTLKPSGDFRMKGELEELSRNDKVKVLEELDGMYLIQTQSGLAYVPLDAVGKEEAVWQDYYSGGGDSGGGGSVGASEWTTPVM